MTIFSESQNNNNNSGDYREELKKLEEALIQCRNAREKKNNLKAKYAFTQAQKYYERLWALYSYEDMCLKCGRRTGPAVNELKHIEAVVSEYILEAPYFEYDLSKEKENVLAYLSYLRGVVLCEGGKYEAAINYLNKSLSYSSTDYKLDVYHYLGIAYHEANDFEKATEIYRQLMQEKGYTPGLRVRYAKCILGLGLLDSAQLEAKKALEAMGDKIEYAYDLAEATTVYFLTCYLQDKFAESLEVIESGIKKLERIPYKSLPNKNPETNIITPSIVNPDADVDNNIVYRNEELADSYYFKYLILRRQGSPESKTAPVLAHVIELYPDFDKSEDKSDCDLTFQGLDELKRALEEEKNSGESNKEPVRNNEQPIQSSKNNNTSESNNKADEKAALESMLAKLNGKNSAPIEDTLAELNALIGLAAVKKEVEGLVNVVRNRKKREALGIKIPPLSLHMVFSGNPGTGKTTVARLIAKIYHELGLISGGQLIEVDRSKLVAGYVGQTAIQTQEVINSAIGGVLFIDEAYTLSKGKDGKEDFGQEAIDTLLKAMEDNRDNLIVIVAGYPELMDEFLHSNPGLESRFNTIIHFEDYNAAELLELLKFDCKQSEMYMSDEAETYAKAYFEKMCENLPKNFSNGRYVRNIFEKVCRNQDNRVAKIPNPTKEDMLELTVMDFDGI